LVAPHDACVLITGQSGTGKELVARAIHRHSARRDKPFFPIHVAALNPNLVESELFGHVRGAFTGASQARAGLFDLADGGTIFLDELADIPLAVQAKLLRVLEHQEVVSVGGNQPRSLDLRILTATHQDLARLVTAGSFRHDLYFRLNVFPIPLPPLRERGEDVCLLAEHFLSLLAPASLPLPAPTRAHLLACPWLGNVRELRNALEHAAILARGGPLLPEHFPEPLPPWNGQPPAERLDSAVREWLNERLARRDGGTIADLYGEFLRAAEPVLLAEVMKRVHGNRWSAARLLGLNRATVRKKLAAYGLSEAHRADDDSSP
jgi:two-component system, NtrC family, nitrogen regulation response regulator GlnG